MAERRCENCKWFRDSAFNHGDCDYPLPQWAKLILEQVYRTAFPREILGPFTLRPDEGKDCPTWHPAT